MNNGPIKIQVISFILHSPRDYTVEEISKVRQFHAIAEKDLQEKLKAKKSLYEGNVKMHMGTEKRARVELNKRILQLQELCKTYDQMMLQKMQEETFLNNRCEKLKKDVDKFQIEFDRVEEIYNEFAARANEKNRFRVASRAVRKIKYWYEDRLKRRDKAALRGAKTQGKNTKTAEAGVKTKKSKKK
uniref:Dynein regulatory complex protein 10 n=1 Tax=Glossina pallidipes TaxID=7398 RepID=A0A1A9ZUT9_GLOPL